MAKIESKQNKRVLSIAENRLIVSFRFFSLKIMIQPNEVETEIIKNSRISSSDDEGMQINDLEAEPKHSAMGGAISKTKVQPMNESKESIESSSVAHDDNGPEPLVKAKNQGKRRMSKSKTVEAV